MSNENRIANISTPQIMNKASASTWYNEVGTQAGKLRDLLDIGFQQKAWIALGHLTWSDLLKAAARDFDLSLRHVRRIHASNVTQKTNDNIKGDIVSPLILHDNEAPIPQQPDGQRGINRHDGNLQNTIATCGVCGELYDGTAISYCPYCAYTQEQRMAYVIDKQQSPKMVSSSGRNLDALMTSQSEEWYTTPDIINLAIAAMGGIDLDPCSNSHEDPNVPATYHFTKEDDGLSQNWLGRVYMNPPYGTAIPHWISKVIEEYEAGHVSKAVVLVPSRTDTRWFRMLKRFPRCFMWGRVRFNNHTNSAPFPTMLVALGIDIDHFKKVMEDTGDVYAIV